MNFFKSTTFQLVSASFFFLSVVTASLSTSQKKRIENLNSELELMGGKAMCDDKVCKLWVNDFPPVPPSDECTNLGFYHSSLPENSSHLLINRSFEKSKLDEFFDVVDQTVAHCLYGVELSERQNKWQMLEELKQNKAEEKYSLSSKERRIWKVLNDNTSVKSLHLTLTDIPVDWPVLAESVSRNENIEKITLGKILDYEPKTATVENQVKVGDLSIFKKLTSVYVVNGNGLIRASTLNNMLESAATKCPILTDITIQMYKISNLTNEKDFRDFFSFLANRVVPNIKDGVSVRAISMKLHQSIDLNVNGLSMELAKALINRSIISDDFDFQFRFSTTVKVNSFGNHPFEIKKGSLGAPVFVTDGGLTEDQKNELTDLAKKNKIKLTINREQVVKEGDFV